MNPMMMLAASAAGLKEEDLDEIQMLQNGQAPGSSVGQTLNQSGVPGGIMDPNSSNFVQPPALGGGAPDPMQANVQQGMQAPDPVNAGSGAPQYTDLQAAQTASRGRAGAQQMGNAFNAIEYRRRMDNNALGMEQAAQTDAANQAAIDAGKRRKELVGALSSSLNYDITDDASRANMVGLARLIESDAPEDIIQASLDRLGITGNEAEGLLQLRDMPAELRTKVALTHSAVVSAERAIGQLFDENGNMTVGFSPGGFFTGMNTPAGRRGAATLRRSLIDMNRAVSGAAVPEEELQREVDMHMPQAGDTQETIKNKMQNLINTLNARGGVFSEGYDMSKFPVTIGDSRFGAPKQAAPVDREDLRARYGLM